MPHDPYTWTPIESWAAEHGFAVDAVIRGIEANRIISGRIEGHWHLCQSRVELTHPDPADRNLIRLRIAAAGDGRYLAAGPDIVTLDFRYDSDACHHAFNALTLACESPGRDLVVIELGDDHWLVDRSLHADLGAALLCLQVEMDLGELMEQYPPDGSTDHLH